MFSSLSFLVLLKLEMKISNCNIEKRIEAAKQLLRKQELECSLFSQELNQFNAVIQDDNTSLENTQLKP